MKPLPRVPRKRNVIVNHPSQQGVAATGVAEDNSFKQTLEGESKSKPPPAIRRTSTTGCCNGRNADGMAQEHDDSQSAAAFQC